jgi:tyrosyl-tRNA synthetase
MDFSPRSPFLRTFVDRGYLHQSTDATALDQAFAAGKVTAYIGFDCTASSLHVGSLVQIMMLRLLQKHGHKPIVLLGGGTTRIGDPSGRDESRQLLSDERIAANMAGIRAVFDRFITFGEGPTDAVLVNNADWLDRLEYIPFLRDFGRHFSVNRMLSFDSVKLRLEREQALSFLEFNYMILQAYDFLELHRRFGCSLQIGGSDQWGNIVNGVELTRKVDGAPVFGLTSPLITTASGAKMGKTAEGAVWLDPNLVSPWNYWQYWRNTADADVGRFLRLFTELPLEEIQRLEALRGAELNDAKKVLANETTRLLHGAAAAEECEATARRTFEERGTAEGLPSVSIARAELEAGIPIFELLVRAGLCASNGEGRRLVKQGGARLNDVAVTDELRKVTLADVLEETGAAKLSSGKKKHVLVKPE